MIKLFPTCSFSFKCNGTKDAVVNKIIETANEPCNELKVVGADTSRIIVEKTNADFLWRNSFAPIATIRVQENGSELLLLASFELKKSVKRMGSVMLGFLLVFEAIIIALAMTTPNLELLFAIFPILYGMFMYCVSFVGLKLTSKKVWEIFLYELEKI